MFPSSGTGVWSALVLAAVVAIASTGACGGGDGDGQAGGTGTVDEDDPCDDCEPDETGVLCVWNTPGNETNSNTLCVDPDVVEDDTDLENACDIAFGELADYASFNPASEFMACADQIEGTGGKPAELNPTTYITRTGTNAFDVDETMIDILRDNPWQLSQESGHFHFVDASPEGYFEFQGGSAGEILNTLGFQNGDQIISVDGHEVTNYTEAVDLWLALQGETQIDVKVERSSTTVVLVYDII